MIYSSGMDSDIKIIIADDHRLMRRVLRNIFDREGMKVVAEARNSEEVFQQIDTQNADVLVLDLSMPGKSGLEILQEIHETGKHLPVVVLTLFPHERFKEKAMRLGAADFLSKDCNPEELVEAVRNAIEPAA